VTVKVSIDGEAPKSLQTVNFCIANARYFGGGMMIAPDAKLSDGFLNVVNIGDIATAKVLLNAHTLYRGTHGNLAEVNERLAKRVEVQALDPDVEVRLETDGELPGRLPAVYEVVPSTLSVRVPRKERK
jgi:diacylglycerol kinase family enzyme